MSQTLDGHISDDHSQNSNNNHNHDHSHHQPNYSSSRVGFEFNDEFMQHSPIGFLQRRDQSPTPNFCNPMMTRALSSTPSNYNNPFLHRFNDDPLGIFNRSEAPRLASWEAIDPVHSGLSPSQNKQSNSQCSNIHSTSYNIDEHEISNSDDAESTSDEKQYTESITKTPNSNANSSPTSQSIAQSDNRVSHPSSYHNMMQKSSQMQKTINSVSNRRVHASNANEQNSRKRPRCQPNKNDHDYASLHCKKKRIRMASKQKNKNMMSQRRLNAMNDNHNTPGGPLDDDCTSIQWVTGGPMQNVKYYSSGEMTQFYEFICKNTKALLYQPKESRSRWKILQRKIANDQCWGYVVKQSRHQITHTKGVCVGHGGILNNLIGLILFEIDTRFDNCLLLTIIAEQKHYDVMESALRDIVPKIRKQQPNRPVINCYIASQDKDMKKLLKNVGFKKTPTRIILHIKASAPLPKKTKKKDANPLILIGPDAVRKCPKSMLEINPNRLDIFQMTMKGYALQRA